MLKRIALLLIFAILLGLSACDTKDPEIKISEVNAGGSEEVTLEILSAKKTKDNGTVLEIRWNNGTLYDILYGEFFGIQRLEGETWVALPMKENTAFNAIGYSLPSKSSVTKDYALDWAYDVSEGGTYRFTTDCTVYDTAYGTKSELWVEFQIESSPESEKQDVLEIPTNGNANPENYPRSIRIRDWETWKADYRDAFDDGGQYRKSFFRDKDLLLLLLGEGSSSVRHKLVKTEFANGTLLLWINQNTPNATTMDLTRWYLLVPLDKELDVTQVHINPEDVTDIQIQPVTTDEVFREPPKLEIVYDGGQFEAFRGGYTWSHPTGDGTWATICADALHPLQMKQHLELISCGSDQIQLLFADAPDHVALRCWSDDRWGKTHAPSETVQMQNGTVQLRSGGWIYEVTATWNNDGGSYYGTATYVFYMAPAMLHDDHLYSLVPQTVEEPLTFWCGNTTATLHLAGESFSFMGGNAIALSDILVNLAYDPEMICRCMAEYTADTETEKGYQINLTQGFVRCEKGQAALTREQVDALRAIVEWAEHETRER